MSEGSRTPDAEILRCAQDDTPSLQMSLVAWHKVMHMIRKGQVRGVGKGDITDQVAFIASLFGVAA